MTKNIIQKTILNLQYNGNADGFFMQKEISDWCHLGLLPSLEEILEKADTGTTIKKIDRIELEIDIGNKADWLSHLSKEISFQLQKKLNELKPEADGNVREQTVSQGFFEILISFLQKGYLPWSATIRNRGEFSAALLAAVEKGINDDIKSQLMKVISAPVARRRLVDQLNDKEWLHLAVLFYPDHKDEIQSVLKDIETLLSIIPEEEGKQVKKGFKLNVLENIGNSNSREALREVAIELAKKIYSLFYPDRKGTYKKYQPASIILDEAMGKVEKEAEENLFRQSKRPDAIRGLKDEQIKQADKGEPEEQASETSGESIYINNAGLVILAPFLPAFFKKLNLANEDKITQIELAVNLTTYLATGMEYAAEFEMVFAKILCGIDPSVPVSPVVAFTEEQKKESQELLLSAIEYWNVLKDTSPEGLRESFLQREGKLNFINEEWILQVEQKPYDMLLQSLPWNISMIRLPWMKWMLKTEW
jgi:hypothetical protein